MKATIATTKHDELIEYIRLRTAAGGGVDAADLVAWDAANGRTIFEWDDAVAGAQYRVDQAQKFLQRIEMKLKNLQVRALYGINGHGYYAVRTIRETPSLRAQAMAEGRRRFLAEAATFCLWEITDAEWADLVAAATKAARG